jgi:signal peptidase I
LKLWRALAFLAVALAASAFVVARWVLVPYRIRGSSMMPTLVGTEDGNARSTGDIVLVNRLAYCAASSGGPSRWDVVILRHADGEESVKRVVGLPGETVEIREGALVVNGARIELPAHLAGEYIVEKGRFGHAPAVLGDGEYFVLGDSSYLSQDSRRWGPVGRAKIEGRVMCIVFPLGRAGWVK